MSNEIPVEEHGGAFEKTGLPGIDNELELAEALLQTADVPELKACVVRLAKLQHATNKAFGAVLEHYQGKNEVPMAFLRDEKPETVDSVNAMKEVALAALALARLVCETEDME